MIDSRTNDEAAGGAERDFDDVTLTGHDDLRLSDVDPAVLRHPVVVRSILGVLIAVAIIIWPDRTDQILARLVGCGLLVLGALAARRAIRSWPEARLEVAGSFATMTVGVVLLAVAPDRAGSLLGRILGIVTLAVAVRIVVGVLRGPPSSKAWPLAQAGVLAGAAALLLAFPEELLTTAVALFGLGWAALGVIAITMSLDRSSSRVATFTDAGQLVATWLNERPKSADDRQALYAKILYDGPQAGKRVVRFFTLMGFAAVIASTGIIGDSTAVVIGAMLIAPLMTPLMGMAISLVMGWPNRLGRSALIAGAGILFAITLGLVLGLVSPVAIDTTTNSQILARTSPTILDLLIAMAAGAAGAYGLSRPDVSDSLPGVAIAISLVPPLAVVGISYSQGDWQAGAGALLLFATNMLAILLVGGATFVVTGVTPLNRLTDNQHRTRTSLAAVAGLATIVLGALLLNGAQVARDVASQGQVDATVAEWLEPHPDHDPVQVTVSDDTVTAVLLGPSADAPEAAGLATALANKLGRPITVKVRLVVEERDAATAEPG